MVAMQCVVACNSFAISCICSIEDATLGHAELVALAKAQKDVQKPNTAVSYTSAVRTLKVWVARWGCMA